MALSFVKTQAFPVASDGAGSNQATDGVLSVAVLRVAAFQLVARGVVEGLARVCRSSG
jgi:hypothetical protein